MVGCDGKTDKKQRANMDNIVFNFSDYIEMQGWDNACNSGTWEKTSPLVENRIKDLQISGRILYKKELDYPFIVAITLNRIKDEKGGFESIPPVEALKVIFYGKTGISVIQNRDLFSDRGNHDISEFITDIFRNICDYGAIVFKGIPSYSTGIKNEPGVRVVWAPVMVNMNDNREYFISALEEKIKEEFEMLAPAFNSRTITEEELKEIEKIIKKSKIFKQY
jgi:hypothetical protein